MSKPPEADPNETESEENTGVSAAFEQISREFLFALRGGRSQTAWSRRLGYKSNVAYAWEAGRRWPTAAETLRACRKAGLDLDQAFAAFYGRRPAWLSQVDPASPQGVAVCLEDLKGKTSIVDWSRVSGISRFSLSRWIAGQTEPRLPDFLHAIERVSLRMVDFVTCLLDPREIPSILPLWERLESRRRGALEAPWTQAILRALELQAYRALPAHQPGWIAATLGLPPEEETRCIELLREAGRIRWDGAHYSADTGAVDTRQHPEVGRRLKAHWTRLGAEKVEAGAPGQFSYNVFGVSRADFERIRAAHLDYFRLLRAIVAESNPVEVVAVANVQLFALEPAEVLGGGSREPAG